jgi:NAD(P) transhydrogenase
MSRCHEYDLICIGSGPAGQRAAIQAAKLGKKVAVIEKQRFVGGVCIDTGTIPSKTFREAVRRMYSRPGLELTDPFAYTPRIRPTMQQLIGHGRLAACHMFGVEAEPMGNHFPVGIYAIPEVSMVGATEEELTRDKIPYETGIARYKEISRGPILGDDSGMFKMLFHREDGRLLGCHCIGSGATELVHVGQAVLGLGGGLDYFLKTVFNYPTLAECYKVAAYNAANKLALVRHATGAAVPAVVAEAASTIPDVVASVGS